MVDFTHSYDSTLGLNTQAMAYAEYEGGFLLPQLMGALASECREVPSGHIYTTRQNMAWVLKLCARIFRR